MRGPLGLRRQEEHAGCTGPGLFILVGVHACARGRFVGAGHLIEIDRLEFDEKFYPAKVSHIRRAHIVEDEASAHAQRCHSVQTQQLVLNRLMKGV